MVHMLLIFSTNFKKFDQREYHSDTSIRMVLVELAIGDLSFFIFEL